MYRYQLPVEQTGWTLQSETQTSFTWEYEDERAKLLALYDKGKKQQWDAAVRIDWSLDLDPENPQEIDDQFIPIYGSAVWSRLTDKEKVRLRHHQQAQSLSQFMHGEQGALMAAARIVQTVPDLDAKFYAATQVMDEARHVEAYARLLNEKWLQAHPERSPEQAAAMWYERMSRVLARRGMKKTLAQTPQEFVKKIEDTRLREPVARFGRRWDDGPCDEGNAIAIPVRGVAREFGADERRLSSASRCCQPGDRRRVGPAAAAPSEGNLSAVERAKGADGRDLPGRGARAAEGR